MQVVEAHSARIPALGLGTWDLRGDVCTDMVEQALRLGYRHIDTAQAYDNEHQVGEGLRASGVKREDVFVTTKVWWTNFAARDLEPSVEQSLTKLKLPRADLLLLHWPNPAVPLAQTIEALCKVKARGLTRHIGISNFTVAMVEDAVRLSSEPIVTNQIEYHPYLNQTKVVAACRRHGISVTAYCPIARGVASGEAVLARIGKAHGKTAAQISLRWLIQQGVIVIPRTSKVVRLKENMAIFDFELTEAEMKEINTLARPDGRMVNVSWAPHWD